MLPELAFCCLKCFFRFSISAAVVLSPALADDPRVVATDPVDGSVNVDRAIESFSVTFDKAMQPACGAVTWNWMRPDSEVHCDWSADQKTVTMHNDSDQLLGIGVTVTVSINPAGSLSYQDLEGNYAEPYTFSFRTSEDEINKVQADANKGFHWPCFLYVPPRLRSPAFLLVEPNNSGTPSDDSSVHEQSARDLVEERVRLADQLGAPLLVPVFPRPSSHREIYTHALDRATLLTTLPGLERIDLQLLAMIDDALETLEAAGNLVDPRVWMIGISASGQFTSRFVMLHPDRVKAASIGAPGFGPIVPVERWSNETLPYPICISDLENLVGKPFDRQTFRQIPLQIWVGDEDTNIVEYFHPERDPEAALVAHVFGAEDEPEMYTRWPAYETAYDSVTSMAQFLLFPALGHAWPEWEYIETFLEQNRQDPPPEPLVKPWFYRVFFRHVACISPWTTEISLYQTKPGVFIRGELEAYSEAGVLLETKRLNIESGERIEIVVDDFFDNPNDVAYLAYHSDSGFVNGYTRFYEPLNRVTIPVTTGSRRGWFPKQEPTPGWTGIALVNTEEREATVRIEALDEAGTKLETLEFTLDPGQKKVALTRELFSSDLSRIRYYFVDSDRLLAGFAINATQDRQMMDGMPLLTRIYLR